MLVKVPATVTEPVMVKVALLVKEPEIVVVPPNVILVLAVRLLAFSIPLLTKGQPILTLPNEIVPVAAFVKLQPLLKFKLFTF